MKYSIVAIDYWVEWCKDGEVHRLYGPAVEFQNGYRIWSIHGDWIKEAGPM